MNTTSRKPDSVSKVNITPLDGEIGAHHLHHPDGERDLEVIEAVVDAIDDGAVGEQRGKAAPAGLEQVLLATDVQIALVLTGEARGRQILGGRRAAHGDRHVGAVLLLELAIGGSDRLRAAPPCRSPHRRSRAPCGTLRQKRDIGLVELIECRMQRLPGLRGGQGVAIGLRDDGKAVRHAYTLGG